MAGETGLKSTILARRWALLVSALVGTASLASLVPGPSEPTRKVAAPRTARPLATPRPTTAAPPGGRSGPPAPMAAAVDRTLVFPLGGRAPRKTTLHPVPSAPSGTYAPVDCRVRKCLALTFDDGPVPGTARLLDTLKARGVRATFFVLGCQVRAYPHIVRRASAEGHEIGDHSYSHANLAAESSTAVEGEITRTQRAIRQATGRTSVLFRPPYGATDAQVAMVARRHDVAQILWAVDPLDWRDRSAATVQSRVVRSARRGSIILLHDIHPTTVAAVPGLITKLTKDGFVFVTVSELYGGRPLTPGKTYTSAEPRKRKPKTRSAPSPTASPTPGR
ncbi:MAG TPA: polysaccharide deacetylase family protein [Actinomadura sp.]|nr:polysaccharide deacetylase family protein [Actinomadura sp.]